MRGGRKRVGFFSLCIGFLFDEPFVAFALSSRQRPFITQRSVSFGKEKYISSVQSQDLQHRERKGVPPLLLIPPVGVGIDRNFFNRLHDEWKDLGAPAEMHAPDLLGTGSSSPKPRRFYSPDVWAEQLESYILEEVGVPCVLVVQGGLFPVVLELWRRQGRAAVAGVSCLSPPALRFFASPEISQVPLIRRRAVSRFLWLIANTPFGGWFYRRLRGPRRQPGERTKQFTERNLFAAAADEEWIANCVAGAKDTRNRFATFSYLVGSIPIGGAWRDDRGVLFDSLDVPFQLLRSSFGGIQNATARARPLLDRVPYDASPREGSSASCSVLVDGARQCLPWEQPKIVARYLAKFLTQHFDSAPVPEDAPCDSAVTLLSATKEARSKPSTTPQSGPS